MKKHSSSAKAHLLSFERSGTTKVVPYQNQAGNQATEEADEELTALEGPGFNRALNAADAAAALAVEEWSVRASSSTPDVERRS